jgi:hypothetical protein
MRSSVTRSSRRGGAMILALLFMGVISAGFIVWVSLIQQRARVADFEEQQARKRLSITNAKVLAKEYLLRRVMASDFDDSLNAISNGGSLSNTDWLGNSEIVIPGPGWTGFPLDSSTRLAGLNGFSPTFDYPYSKSLIFTVNNRLLSYVPVNAATNPGLAQFSNDSTTVRGYVRSRNPVLSGDLLVLHRPTVTTTLPTVSGNLEVEGRVVHFAPETTTYSARSQRFTAPVTSTVGVTAASIAGGSLLWSNLSWFPYSVGNIASADLATDAKTWHFPDLTGQLNFIDASTTNPSNNLRAELIASGSTIQATGNTNFSDSRGFTLVSTGTSPAGSGVATITPSIGSTSADLPSIVISDNLTELIIEGQTGATLTGFAPYRPAMCIVYTQTAGGRNLATIRLRNQNTRRLMIALKKDNPSGSFHPAVNVIVETPGTGTSEWNVVFLCENVPLTFTTTTVSTVNIVGGIQTNSPLVFPASPKLFELNLQTDTRGLIRMCPRLTWIETFLTGEL